MQEVTCEHRECEQYQVEMAFHFNDQTFALCHTFGSLTNSARSSFDALDDVSSHSFVSSDDNEIMLASTSSTNSIYSLNESFDFDASSHDLNINEANNGENKEESLNVDGNGTVTITDATIPSVNNVDQTKTKRRKIAKHRTDNSRATTILKTKHPIFFFFLIL